MSRVRGNSYDTLNAKLDEALTLINNVVNAMKDQKKLDPQKPMQLAFFERDLKKIKKSAAEKSQNLGELWRAAIETIDKIKARYQSLQQISEEDETPFDDLANFFNEKKVVLAENPQAFEVQDASIESDSLKLNDVGPASRKPKRIGYEIHESDEEEEEEELVGGKDKSQHGIMHMDQDLDERKEESPRLQRPRHSMVMFHTRANEGSIEFTPEQKVIQEKVAEVLATPVEDNLTEEEVKLYEKKNKNADESDPKVLIIMLNSHVTNYLNLINKFGEADNAKREAIMQELKLALTQIQAELNKKPPLNPDQSVEGINFLLSQIQAAKKIAPAFNKAVAEIEQTGKNPYEKTTARKLKESIFGKSKEPSLTETFNQYKEDRFIIRGLVRALEAQVENLAARLQQEAQNLASSAPNPSRNKFG